MRKLLGLLLFTNILFSDNEWIELTPTSMPEYKVENYTMRDDIDYVELRKVLYDSKTHKPVSTKYIPYFTITRKPLLSYPKKTVKAFRKLKFQKTDVATIADFYGNPRHHYYKVNGFIIKKDGSFLVFNEDVDIGWLFNGIDTLAELTAYTSMRNIFTTTQKKVNGLYKHSFIYRKKDNGYEIKRLDDKGLSYNREKLIEYHTYEAYYYAITKEGALTERKGKSIVEEKKKSKEFFKDLDDPRRVYLSTTPHPDPVWAFHSEEEMVKMELNNPNMIEP